MAVSMAGGSVLFQFSVIGRRYSAAFFPYIGRWSGRVKYFESDSRFLRLGRAGKTVKNSLISAQLLGYRGFRKRDIFPKISEATCF